MQGWSWAAEVTKMLERLDGVYEQQTSALISTRCPGISEVDAANCVNKARTQSTGIVPRPDRGQRRCDAKLQPCIQAARVFSPLVTRKVSLSSCVMP